MAEEFVPNIKIKEYSREYREKVREITLNLDKFYPGIDIWLNKELNKLDSGVDACWMLVNESDNVVGVAVTGLEIEGIGKLKTFYIAEEAQSFALGIKLLKTVLNYWTSKRIRNLFVTFAEEELDELKGFFDKFGFVMDRIMPQYYRAGKTEYVMSKTFVYDEIDEIKFEEFVINFLKMRGIRPTSTGSEFIAEEDNSLTKTPRKIYVKIIQDEKPNASALFRYMQERIKETDVTYGLLISFYPLPDYSNTIKVIDGYLLENILFPLKIKKKGYSGVILPIEEHYAKDLLDIEEPQGRLVKKRVSLTHEKVYYTGKSGEGVSRGDIFFFYLKGNKETRGSIIGEARIKILDSLGVDDAIKKYISRGVIKTPDELRQYSHNGRVTVFLLTNVKKYSKKVSIEELRGIIPDVNFSFQLLKSDEIEKIRKFGENDSYRY